MKISTIVFAIVLCLFAGNLLAGEWTGYISDSKCGKAHSDGSEASIKCVQGCVKAGQAAVFVTAAGGVLKIANQDKVMDHLGKKVTITGKLEGDTLTLDSVKAAD